MCVAFTILKINKMRMMVMMIVLTNLTMMMVIIIYYIYFHYLNVQYFFCEYCPCNATSCIYEPIHNATNVIFVVFTAAADTVAVINAFYVNLLQYSPK